MGDGSHEGGKAVVNGGGAPSKWRRSGEGDDLPKGPITFRDERRDLVGFLIGHPRTLLSGCFAQIHSVGDVRGVANDVNEQRVDGPHRGGGEAETTRRQ